MAVWNHEKIICVETEKEQLEAEFALTQACACGDDEAMRRLAAMLFDRVRALTYTVAGSGPDSDDYAQIALIEILRAAGSFRGESSLQRFTDRITVRSVIREIKRNKRHRWHLPLDVADEEKIAFKSIENEIHQRQIVIKLSNIIQNLGYKFGVPLQLKLALGYSVQEIAELTDTPYNTIRERLRIGRKRLHRAIAEDPFFSRTHAGEDM
ncbi:MAG: RNA polymerase sigma factor [Deltaproteobacteria bacterium]|nr:RNA polymerase sigma factor [Deltaproteobacteria bacterium]